MRQEDIFRAIIDKRKKVGMNIEDLRKESGTVTYGTMFEVFNGKADSIKVNNLIKMMDVLNLEFTIQDKGANWGLDKRLWLMPEKLFLHERIESRAIIRQEGFHARVDLYEDVTTCLKFARTPCDIYEIDPSQLLRKDFVLEDHPYGTMWSYHNWVSPDFIENRTTHK